MENTVIKKQKPFYTEPLFIITAGGFLLRLAFLIFVLTIGRSFSGPYFIVDDIKYENLAETYIRTASHMFDMSTFDEITRGYMQLFWPWVMCVSGYIFKSIYVGRFINIILSSLCIPMLYKITHKISDNHTTAMTAAKVFAFMPVTVMTCVFPIKDIFITLGVLYALYIGLKIYYENQIRIYEYLLVTFMLVCVYLSRGAVTEFILIYYVILFIRRFINKKNHQALVIFAIALLLLGIIFGKTFFSAFSIKIEDYSSTSTAEAGNILSFKINGIGDIYKLPLTYLFASFQPISRHILNVFNADSWLNILAVANVAIYPVSIGNFLYIFSKKKNMLFWLFTAALFCGVIILSLGIFRHYLFLAPIHMINYSLFLEQNRKNNLILCLSFSVLLLCGMLMLSIIAL